MTLWCLAPCVISEEGQMSLQGLVYKVPGLQGRALCKLSRKPRSRCKAMAQNFISEAFKNKRSWPTELQQPWELPTWLIQNYWKVWFFVTAQAIFLLTVMPISQWNCVSNPLAAFGRFRCKSSSPEGRLHAAQRTPHQLSYLAGGRQPFRSCSVALQGSSSPWWSLIVPIWAEVKGLFSQSGLVFLFVCFSPKPLNVIRHK